MLGTGTGSEIRQPLGYAIVGGLFVSQLLTLFTTPVVYIYMDRLNQWLTGKSRSLNMGAVGRPKTGIRRDDGMSVSAPIAPTKATLVLSANAHQSRRQR